VRVGRSVARFAILTATVGLCTLATGTGTSEIPAGVSITAAPTSTTTRECRSAVGDSVVTGTNASQLALEVSRLAFECASAAVVASGDDSTLLAAAQLAAAAGVPLLIPGQDPGASNAELERLGVEAIYVVGEVNAEPTAIDVIALDPAAALAEAARLLGGVPIISVAGDVSLGRLAVAATTGTAVASGAATGGPADQAWLAHHAPANDLLWLGDHTRIDLLAPVLAAAAARGETLLLADPADLRRGPDLVRAYRQLAPSVTVLAGSFDPDLAAWQLPALTTAPELPGGGLTLFPGRRIVALYGNPTTAALGVLGEQGPEESMTRVAEIATGYDGDGTPILPGFEIIATVASASAGADNDYSEEMSLDQLRPWIEVAAANGIYVILDLQPGRTDFLTQAMYYEEFLRLPHVGLALDPEWRLEPDQVHLRQIGSVEATEVNTVATWLAGIVREENLPQKFFLLHQFHLSMIENRADIIRPPELAVVIQMDGQGPLSTKYETWNALLAGTDPNVYLWGWKNFYDEDTPRGGATAEQVLDLEPVPVYVSFQ
jgi:hypothetical protein